MNKHDKDKFESRHVRRICNEYFSSRIKIYNILDVGCGDGRLFNYIYPEIYQYNYCGIDKRYDLDKIWFTPFQPKINMNIALYNVENYIHRKKYYDLIIFSHVLEHMNRFEATDLILKYLNELKTYGYILLLSPYPTKDFYTDYDHISVINAEMIENISKRFLNSNLILKYKHIRKTRKIIEYENGISNYVKRLFSKYFYFMLPYEKSGVIALFQLCESI